METPFVSSEFGKKKEFGRKYANHELDCNCLSIRQLAKRGKRIISLPVLYAVKAS